MIEHPLENLAEILPASERALASLHGNYDERVYCQDLCIHTHEEHDNREQLRWGVFMWFLKLSVYQSNDQSSGTHDTDEKPSSLDGIDEEDVGSPLPQNFPQKRQRIHRQDTYRFAMPVYDGQCSVKMQESLAYKAVSPSCLGGGVFLLVYFTNRKWRQSSECRNTVFAH